MPIPSDTLLTDLAKQLATQLLAQNRLLATAESCTGGWVGKVCTDLPGSSAWYVGGVISYSNEAKMRLLGVSKPLIEQHGAVSAVVASAMVRGAVLALGADYGLSVTGLAGPQNGAESEPPVGTVWVGWGTRDHVITQCFACAGSREDVRRLAVAEVLRGLQNYLQRV